MCIDKMNEHVNDGVQVFIFYNSCTFYYDLTISKERWFPF